MGSIFCFFGFHNWRYLTSRKGNTRTVRRKCKNCGEVHTKEDLHTDKIYEGVWTKR